jgi:hypothetical protein
VAVAFLGFSILLPPQGRLRVWGHMPIRQFFGSQWQLKPEDLDAMNKAFAAARQRLGLSDLRDPMTEIVARRMVDAVLDGERDPIRLTEIGTGGPP